MNTLPPWPHHLDYGVLVLILALILVAILAHRYWRATIRLEDQLLAQGRDAERTFDRYRKAFKEAEWPAAFVDRVSGLVMEAAPGWVAAGLPAAGEAIYREDPSLETAWRTLAPPDPEDRVAAALEWPRRAQILRVRPLAGASLGVVLVTLR